MTERARRILGVSSDASEREVRNAYRRLVKTAHPDLNPDDPNAERRFRDIQTAFRELVDNGSGPTAAPPPPDSRAEPRASPPPRHQPTSTLGLIWWLPVVVVVAILVVFAAVSDDDGTAPAISDEVCVRITDQVTGDGEQVDCSAPHEISLFQSGTITGFSGTYPGDDILADHTASLCDRSFRAIVGEPPDQSGHLLKARYPNGGDWSAGDRDYDCLAFDAAGRMLDGPIGARP